MEKKTSMLKNFAQDSFTVKALICLLLLCGVIGVRVSRGEFSQKLRAAMNSYIGSGADYISVIKSIGEAVGSGGDVMSVFADDSVRVFGKSLIIPQSGTDNAGDSKDDAADIMPSEETLPEELDINDYGEEDEAVNTELYDRYFGDAASVPTSYMPLIGSSENEPYVINSSSAFASLSIKSEDVIDDTPATEFKIPAPDRVDETLYTLPFKYKAPIKGAVTSPFGYRDHPITHKVTFHYGVDIGAKLGDKICSFADGTVTETGTGTINGKYIIVTHKDGFWTRYCHLSKINVKKGQKVKIGEKIGEAGTTGMSTGVHLHFEIRLNDSILNPADYVSFS